MINLTGTVIKSMLHLLVIIFALLMHHDVAATTHPFLGTWKLLSVTQDTVPPSKEIDSFGAHPQGYLNYTADGRMIVIIVQNDRPKPIGQFATDSEAEKLFRTMNSYAGTYTIKKDHIIHHIDVSWNEKWTGTDQIRNYQFVDNKLILSLTPMIDAGGDKLVIHRLTWEKI